MFILIATAVLQICQVGANIVTLRFLGPSDMAVWSLLVAVAGYFALSDLGAGPILAVRIPALAVRNDRVKAHEELTKAIWATEGFGLILLFAFSAALFLVWLWGKLSATDCALFLAAAVLGVTVTIGRLGITYLSAWRAVTAFVIMDFLVEISFALCKAVGAPFGVPAMMLVAVGYMGLLLAAARMAFTPADLAGERWRSIALVTLRDGAAFFAITITIVLFPTAVRFVLAGMLSADALGYFAAAQSLSFMLAGLSVRLNRLALPLLTLVGQARGQSPQALLLPSMVLYESLFLSLAAVGMVVVCDWITPTLFPNYGGALPSLRLISPAGVVQAVCSLLMTGATLGGESHWRGFWYQVAALVCQLVAVAWAISIWPTVEAASAAFAASSLVHMALTVILLRVNAFVSLAVCVKCYLYGLVFGIGALAATLSSPTSPSVGVVAVYAAITAPPGLWAFRKFMRVTRIRAAASETT